MRPAPAHRTTTTIAVSARPPSPPLLPLSGLLFHLYRRWIILLRIVVLPADCRFAPSASAPPRRCRDCSVNNADRHFHRKNQNRSPYLPLDCRVQSCTLFALVVFWPGPSPCASSTTNWLLLRGVAKRGARVRRRHVDVLRHFSINTLQTPTQPEKTGSAIKPPGSSLSKPVMPIGF